MNVFEHNESTLEGTCNITFAHLKNSSYFKLEYTPFSIKLRIPPVKMGQFFAFGYGKFEGKLTDGTIIKCSKIGMSKFSKSEIYFVLLEDLIIGEEVETKIFKTKLIGAYLGKANFQFKNLHISIDEENNENEIINYCRKYGNILEGSELIIKSIDGTYLDKPYIRELSKEICLLFSLINGNTVLFNRYQFISDSSEIQNVWRVELTQPSKGSGCINLIHLGEVLQTILLKFHKLNAQEKKCFFTVVGYLNSTSGQYMEDSILNIAQAWEIMADVFAKEKIDLSPEIAILRKDIKNTIKQWKNTNSITFDTAFLSNRLLNSLSWETAIKKLENLAKKENLNLKSLGLNFKNLVEIRNSIAHTGRFKVIGEEDKNVAMLNAAVLGLQVLILSKLGYEGFIFKHLGGILGSEEITKYKVNHD